MDDRGIPKSVDHVMENAEKLVRDLEAIGVKRERRYLDPLIQAVSTDSKAGLKALEAIEKIHQEFRGVKTICGISNISYALPKRPIINRTFLILAMREGLSAAIIDSLDKSMMATLLATTMFLGEDDYCLKYIKAFREGGLGD